MATSTRTIPPLSIGEPITAWCIKRMAIKHKLRIDENGNTRIINLTARRAIIEHCKECMGFNTAEVRLCTSKLCPLYPFRTRDILRDTA